jgi:response regulator RpfG family c-di-GMP phosphodiesterase
LIRQIADALAEAHRRRLLHRDLKPSNILVTPEGVAKLLDFGLALRPDSARITEHGALIGTIGYMAPEQIKDASSVDVRADIYGLGCSLFWALAGDDPFPQQGGPSQDILRRLTQPPAMLRKANASIPSELESIVAKMMAVRPDDRYATAEAVMRALMPFCRHTDAGWFRLPPPSYHDVPVKDTSTPRVHQVLIVDDQAQIRGLCKAALSTEGIVCHEAPDGESALESIQRHRFDLILLDIDMPRLRGPEVLRVLRQNPVVPHLKVVMFSGCSQSDDVAGLLLAGADDFVSKPFGIPELRARVKSALRLKDAQDRSDILNQHLLSVNAELESNLTARDGTIVEARNALVMALAKLVEYRSTEDRLHLFRLQRYCRALAEEAAKLPVFSGIIDEKFIQTLVDVVPLHDIGTVGVPDHVLLKPGRLDADELLLMQAHTTVGAETLSEVARQYGFAAGFFQMGIDVARHHHERFDGTGYPDRLAGSEIPLSARIVAIADVYDALRTRRPHKPSLSHRTATMTILDNSPGHFDPALLLAFQRVLDQFDSIFTHDRS